MSKVLVTGGSGFVGSHVILQLLRDGHQVHTTVRSLKREKEVRAIFASSGAKSTDMLSFFAADLNSDEGWAEAMVGCDYVIHPASPTPLHDYKNEDEWVRPAREGVLRVLHAAKDARVKRVVLTSAIGAVLYGHKDRPAPFNESDWSRLDGEVPGYQKSKTLAEQAAWDFVKNEKDAPELSVINPVVILGPVLSSDFSHSIHIIRRLLDGEMGGCPKLNFGVVDVRDLADLHLRAMTNPAAKGERFIATAGPSMSMVAVAKILKERMGKWGEKVPSREVPNFVMHLAALFNSDLKDIVPHLGKVMNATSEKARRMLDWNPRSSEEAIVATAESLVKFGLLKAQKESKK